MPSSSVTYLSPHNCGLVTEGRYLRRRCSTKKPHWRLFSLNIATKIVNDLKFKKNLKVKANVDEADSRINASSLSFFKIKSFMMNGSLIASQQHKMEQDIFIPEGMMGVKDLDKRYAQFKRILTEDARSSFVDILKTARATFLAEQAKDVDEEKKTSLLSRKDGLFFKWLKTEPDQVNGPVNKNQSFLIPCILFIFKIMGL